MNNYNRFKTLLVILTLGIVGYILPVNAQEESDKVYDLSPFTVESDDSEGYVATSTLAGNSP